MAFKAIVTNASIKPHGSKDGPVQKDNPQVGFHGLVEALRQDTGDTVHLPLSACQSPVSHLVHLGKGVFVEFNTHEVNGKRKIESWTIQPRQQNSQPIAT